MTDMESLELALMGDIDVDNPRQIEFLISRVRFLQNRLAKYEQWQRRVSAAVRRATEEGGIV